MFYGLEATVWSSKSICGSVGMEESKIEKRDLYCNQSNLNSLPESMQE